MSILDTLVDVLVLRDIDGTTNLVSTGYLSFGGKFRKGTRVSMSWKGVSWLGQVTAKLVV